MAWSFVPVSSALLSLEKVHFSRKLLACSSSSTSRCQKLFATAFADNSPANAPEVYNIIIKDIYNISLELISGIYDFSCVSTGELFA